MKAVEALQTLPLALSVLIPAWITVSLALSGSIVSIFYEFLWIDIGHPHQHARGQKLVRVLLVGAVLTFENYCLAHRVDFWQFSLTLWLGREREFFVGNLLVRIRYIIVMIR